MFPKLKSAYIPTWRKNSRSCTRKRFLEMFPDLPRKQAETQDPAELSGGLHHRHRLDAQRRLSHEIRAADYDDWVTDTR